MGVWRNEGRVRDTRPGGSHLLSEFVLQLLLSTGQVLYPSCGTLIIALKVLDSFPQCVAGISFLFQVRLHIARFYISYMHVYVKSVSM